MMALVDYSDSEDSSDSQVDAPSKATENNVGGSSSKEKNVKDASSDLPPLPITFHDLYASTSRISNTDDPSLHGGRQRAVPHVEGQWPTHVYVECEPCIWPLSFDIGNEG